MSRIGIIGAGAAGLVAAKEMIQAGHDVTVFEQSPATGGIWDYTELTDADVPAGDAVWSSVYASLRTNLPRDIMAYLDYTFDSAGGGADDWPRFPHHALVLQYLRNFASHFDINDRIRFSTRVTSVMPIDDGWRIETLDCSRDSKSATATASATFDAVMVCNGHYARPRVPELAGIDAFPGRIWHSHNYRTPERFAGRRVALWGTSASGADISLELSKVADVIWCGNAFADVEPGRTIRGNIRVYPSPRAVTPDGRLQFDHGSASEAVDDFMFCTGYRYDFPFLSDDIVRVDDNWVNPLYQQIVPPAHPTLAFIGIPFLIVPFPLFEMQARWFGALIDGRVSLPPTDEMQAAVAAEREAKRALGWPQRHMHKLGEAQTDYYNLLAGQCGEPALPEWFGTIANDAQQARIEDPEGFRDRPFPAPGPTKVL